MLAIIAAVLWILLDVAMTLLTSPPIPLWHWRTIVYGGGAVVTFTIVAGIYEHFHTKKEDRIRAQEMTGLKERLIKQEGFNEGAFTALGHAIPRVESATPESTGVISELREELQKYRSRIAEVLWTPLTADQKSRLRRGLSKLRPANIEIGYFAAQPDSESLARDLEQVFRDVGWTLDEKAFSIESKSELDPWPFVLPGIKVHASANLAASLPHHIRDVLNEIFPEQTESIKNEKTSEPPKVALIVGSKKPRM
jgi:hypothetical protein